MAKKSKIITKKQFDSFSSEKQQRLLNNTRTRVRIEDKALPPEWLERRKKARWNRTPITEGSGTTYGDLEKQRKYLEPLTFGEGDRQLADRAEGIAAARQRDASWFEKYRADVAAAQQAAIGAQQQAVTGNQAFIDSANQVSASSRDAIAAQLQDRARQLGQVDQSAEYRGLADAAAASRASGLANTAMRQVGDANAGVNVAAAGVGTAALRDLEAQGYRDYQGRLLDKDKAGYASKKDEWRAKFIDDAISEARRQVLEDRAFGLKAADTQADNALAKRKQRQAERQARRELALKRQTEARLQQQADRKAASGGSRGGGSGGKSGGNGRTGDVNKQFQRAIKSVTSVVASDIQQVIDTSQKGASQGRALPGGADSVVRAVMNKADVPRNVALRALYLYIAYKGNPPSSATYNRAPKKWGQALKRGGYRK